MDHDDSSMACISLMMLPLIHAIHENGFSDETYDLDYKEARNCIDRAFIVLIHHLVDLAKQVKNKKDEECMVLSIRDTKYDDENQLIYKVGDIKTFLRLANKFIKLNIEDNLKNLKEHQDESD